MRIISQNHSISYPFDKLVVWVDEKNVLCEVVGNQRNTREVLGTYESHERAKEVFHAIHSHYENVHLLKDLKAVYRQRSFEMPEE